MFFFLYFLRLHRDRFVIKNFPLRAYRSFIFILLVFFFYVLLIYCYKISNYSFGIDSDKRFPFFIADGGDCAIAVEFLRFAVNVVLLLNCKAALALLLRGGESDTLTALVGGTND